MKDRNLFSRRRFLKGAAAAVALPTIVPASAFGRGGRVAPSNRITMGFIGVGSQGRGNMNWFLGKDEVQVVAVCDVDDAHARRAKESVDRHYENAEGAGCASYVDFRDLVARTDLDAVALALPDQWHAAPAISAARAGLDIYGEKPLARTIRESRAICDAVQGYGRVWQTGSWQRSREHFRHAAELVRNGLIGKVERVEVGLPTGGTCEPKPPKPVPEGLHWDRWLGPAPWRPYCEFGGNKCHWDWRWIMDFSGGQLTDWAGHHIDIAHWGLGFDETGPVEIEGRGEYPSEGLWNAPTAYDFRCRYTGGLELRVANNKKLGFMGAKWHGEDGWVHVWRGGLQASDPRLLDRAVIGPDDLRLHPDGDGRDHVDDFLACVKSRAQTVTPVETACRSISVGLLGEIAMLTGRRIRWDPEREEILDDPGASALLGRAYREPWVL